MKRAYFFLSATGLMLSLFGCGTGTGYSSDGEAIYMTGKTRDGKEVPSIVDKSALPDKSFTLSCAGCHGTSARGGKNTIVAFGPYIAPDITWNTLTSAQDGVAYTEASFASALRDGIAPQGYRLHFPMPRWELTDEQIQEVIAFLKTK